MPRRSNRKRGSFRSSRARRGDWVYRDQVIDDNGVGASDGTWSPVIFAQTSGQANRRGFVLYDSQNFLRQMAGSGAVDRLSNAARAEGKRPLMLEVDGHVYMEPTVWAVGNIIAWGLRILIDEQDPSAGGLVQAAAYSMWANVGVQSSAFYANQPNWIAEKRIYKVFNASQDSHRDFTWNVKFRRRLQAHQALWIYSEGESTSVNTRLQFYMRTRVVDEG